MSSALVKSPPMKVAKDISEEETAVRNGTSLAGDFHFLFLKAEQGCKNWNETYPEGWC